MGPTSSKKLASLGLAILLAVLLISWSGLRQIKTIEEQNLRTNLLTILKVAHEALHIWFSDRIDDANLLAGNKLLIRLANELEQNDLPGNDALETLRQLFHLHFTTHRDDDFLLIAKEGNILASCHDENIGQISPLVNFTSFSDTIFSGNAAILLPQGQNRKLPRNLASDIFIGVPVHAESGMLALVLQIDPGQDFSRTISMVHATEAGEIYIFNHRGIMVSSSRFEDQLIKTGLIHAKGDSIGLELRDPGGNLLKGFPLPEQDRDLPLIQSVQRALDKTSGHTISPYRNYRGVPVVGAWHWNNKYNFGVAFEIDYDAAFRSSDHINKTTALFFFLISLSFGIYIFTLIKQNRSILRMAEDTKQMNLYLQAAEQEAKSYRDQLKSMIQEQTLVEEQERRRIALELHDEVAQMLTVAIIKQQKLQATLGTGEDKQYAQEIIDLLENVLHDLRCLIFELSLLVSYHNDLNAAIEGLGRKILLPGGVDFNFATTGEQKEIREESRSLVCRIARELFYNVLKHAEAKRVKTTMHWRKNRICLTVIDDGKGFDNHAIPRKVVRQDNFGLQFIKERLDYLHGNMEIVSTPHQGTEVHVYLPYEQIYGKNEYSDS